MNSKPKILFVDDEPNFLSGIKRMLYKHVHKWDLVFAGSVDEALGKRESTEFDLIVTDLNMPRKSGFDLLKAVCGNDPQAAPPVVVLTGNNKSDLKRKALECGASDLLNKPVDPEDLIARVTSTLRIKAYQDEIKRHNESLARKVAERTADLEVSRLDILWRLAKAGEYRDEDTGNHTVRVGLFCREIASALGLPDDFIETLFLTSPLHDIGKIGISDSILLKRGKLTSEEWQIMRTHCAIGASILKDESRAMPYFIRMKSKKCDRFETMICSDNPLLGMAALIAHSHHERWDGGGYPRGLSGEDIPIAARIVALADVYDALKSVRPYKPAFSDEKTLSIIREETGRHFDPAVVRVFEEKLDDMRAIGSELHDDEGH
ncbi:MAG: HD domain-containing phosphohydrolase [Pseudomonadota bacterium]